MSYLFSAIFSPPDRPHAAFLIACAARACPELREGTGPATFTHTTMDPRGSDLQFSAKRQHARARSRMESIDVYLKPQRRRGAETLAENWPANYPKKLPKK